MIRIALLLSIFILSQSALAGDISWSGRYRIEGVSINNPTLQSSKSTKSYFLHHLVLSPKIVAADGINIVGRFDILNNRDYTTYGNAMGEYLGAGPNSYPTSGTTTSTEDSNALGKNNKPGTLQVSELYLTWLQEFGTLVAGRMPVHFGLGVTHNAGNGVFDHFYDTRDAVGYRMLLGNLTLFPTLGKINRGSIDKEDDVNDYMFNLQYENPETELVLGLMYDIRISTGADTPTSLGPAGSTATGAVNYKLINLFVQKGTTESAFRFGGEAGFLKGSSGLKVDPATDVNFDAYAIAMEFDFRQSGTHVWNLKTGIVSGDNPATTASFEGFSFNRNYHLGMLLFNHVLGQYDLLQTTAAGRGSATRSADTEALSNAIYLSPAYTYNASEKWAWGTRVVYANLMQEPQANRGIAKDLGYELDLSGSYKPNDRMIWTNELGVLFPGAAFQGGTNNYEKVTAYGLSSKIGVSF